ncbi:unnamed protein product, partial [Amoebophrya sp. A25]
LDKAEAALSVAPGYKKKKTFPEVSKSKSKTEKCHIVEKTFTTDGEQESNSSTELLEQAQRETKERAKKARDEKAAEFRGAAVECGGSA